MNIINHKVFPSIITEISCSQFNLIQPDLIDWIYKYQNNEPGVVFTNRGGWQSPSNCNHIESFFPYFNFISYNVFSAINFYNVNLTFTNMWININQRGNYNTTHVHPGALISGVFWVKTSENCGMLKFLSPNHYKENYLIENANVEIKTEHNYSEHFFVNPQEGKIVLFPSHLYHMVESNESEYDRISIAFNLTA